MRKVMPKKRNYVNLSLCLVCTSTRNINYATLYFEVEIRQCRSWNLDLILKQYYNLYIYLYLEIYIANFEYVCRKL